MVTQTATFFRSLAREKRTEMSDPEELFLSNPNGRTRSSLYHSPCQISIRKLFALFKGFEPGSFGCLFALLPVAGFEGKHIYISFRGSNLSTLPLLGLPFKSNITILIDDNWSSVY